LGTSVINGTGTFTLANTGTLIVGSTDVSGAISASGGNIRVGGAKTYNTGSTIIYRNATNSPQFMASDNPGAAGITTTIDNTGGVTLVSSPYTLNGTLTLTNGNFIINARSLTLGGLLNPGANFIVGDNATALTISDAGGTVLSTFDNLALSGTSVVG